MSTTAPRPPAPSGTTPVSHAAVRKPVLGARAVGSFVPRLTRPAFEKFGFSAATLITDWAQIVGAEIGRATEPERLRWPKGPAARGTDAETIDQGRPAATLTLRVEPGRALDIEYRRAQIIERINAYFGYRAVADVRLIQTPLARKPAAAAPVAPCPPQPPPAEVVAVTDDRLREALARMAAGLSARRAQRRAP